jgi:hypothetical protein
MLKCRFASATLLMGCLSCLGLGVSACGTERGGQGSENLGSSAAAVVTCNAGTCTCPGGWKLDPRDLEGYADQISAYPGDTINFYVNNPADGTPNVHVDFLRYGPSGSGDVGAPEHASPQPLETSAAGVPIDIPATQQCIPDPYVASADMDWVKAFSITVPTWASGLYSAHITDANGINGSNVMFVVKDIASQRKPVVVLASTNTWEAYNEWPFQFNLYDGGSGVYAGEYNVSFLRPNTLAEPDAWDIGGPGATPAGTYPKFGMDYVRTEHLAAGEIRLLRWFELSGVPYSLISDFDLDQMGRSAPVDPRDSPLSPINSPTLVISTHNEYWSQSMYDALAAFERAGGNVISLSGNTIGHRVYVYGENTDSEGTFESGSPGTATWRLIKKGDPSSTGVNPWDWTPDQRAGVLAVAYEDRDNPPQCNPFVISTAGRAASHWAFGTIPGIFGGASVGIAGEDAVVATLDGEIAGVRSYCSNTGVWAGGAAGWEVDGFPAVPHLARTYNRIASDSVMGAAMAYRRQTAGQVFAAGSITFGQSLLYDFYHANQLSRVMSNVLTRFSSPSFSDFNSDGVADVLAWKSGPNPALVPYFGTSTAGGVSFNQGANISPAPGKTWASYSSLISIGDFDSDGHSDVLALGTDASWYMYCGLGNGTFCDSSTACPFSRCAAIKVPLIDSGWSSTLFRFFAGVGDMDGDGRPDMLAVTTSSTSWPSSKRNVALLYRGDGVGGFVQDGGTVADYLVATDWSGYNTVVPVGDFDGDGNADLIGRSNGGYLDLFLGRGDGRIVRWSSPCVGTTPCPHIDGGWGTIAGFAPVGNLWGDQVPVANLITTAGTGALVRLFKADVTHPGLFVQNGGPTVAGTTALGAYSKLLGVW